MSDQQPDSPAQTIPTLEDWHSEPWDLDIPCAFRNFNGKTVAEAVLLFEENSLRYQEDLMFMPSRVFGYYLRAYIAYLMSPASALDSDGAGCFLGLIAHKVKYKPADVRPLWPEILPVLEHLAMHEEFFDTVPEIDGSFLQRAEEIVTAFGEMKS